MAVFKETMDLLNRMSAVEKKLTGVVTKISDLLFTLFDIVEKIAKILVTAIKALDAIATFIRNTATALDENPLAKGPWKIIFNIAASILRGVSNIIEGVTSLLRKLQQAAKNSQLKKLDEAINRFDDVFLNYAKIVGKAKNKLNKLMAICQLLELQQKKIEKELPTLRKSVNKNILDPIKKLLDSIDSMVTTLSDTASKLDSELSRLKRIAQIIRSIERLANAFRGVVGNFIALVKQLFLAIKKIILSIPFLGWLLDKLDQFIRTAIRAVGLESLLQKLAAQLKSLPFIKRLRELASQLNDFIANLLDVITELEKKLQNATNKFKAISEFIEQAIERFKNIAVSKKQLENDATPQVTAMRDQLEQSLVAINNSNIQQIQTRLTAFEECFWLAHNDWFNGPTSMFGIKVYESFFQYAEHTFEFFQQINETSTEHSPVPVIEQQITHTNVLLKDLQKFNHDTPELPNHYFTQLNNIIKDINTPELNFSN